LGVFWETSPATSAAVLQESNDEGLTWTTVGSEGEPDNWYTVNNSQGLADFGQPGDGWAGYKTAGSTTDQADAYDSAGGMYTSSGSLGSTAWLNARHLISGGEKKRLRVLFASGLKSVNGEEEGFAFDNVRINPVLTKNLVDSLVVDQDSGIAGLISAIQFNLLLR
jgi:hypothetical protein